MSDWKIGDKCFWIQAGHIVQGKVVRSDAAGVLWVKKKGQLQPYALSANHVFQSLPEATEYIRAKCQNA